MSPGYLRALGLVLVGIASVQVGAAFAKDLFSHTTPLGLVCVRQLTAAVILLLWVRPRLRGRSAAAWRTVFGFAIALGGMNWAIYESFARIPLGIAVTIEFLGPLLLAALVSHRRLDLLWVVLAGSGVALLGFEPARLTVAGVGFALLAGTFWVGYILGSTRTGLQWPGLEGIAVASLLCALITTPLLLVSPAGPPPTNVWLVGALVGLLSSVIPYSAELVALRTLPAHTFSITLSLEPAAAALAALVVLGEQLTGLQWLAVALVVVASVGVNTARAAPDAPGLALVGDPEAAGFGSAQGG